MATLTVVREMDGVLLTTWVELAADEQGEAARIAKAADRTVTVDGTFGGSTVSLEGSNDGTNWHPLTAVGGSAITFTAGGVAVIAENTLFVRPSVAGGAGVDVDVIIAGK